MNLQPAGRAAPPAEKCAGDVGKGRAAPGRLGARRRMGINFLDNFGIQTLFSTFFAMCQASLHLLFVEETQQNQVIIPQKRHEGSIFANILCVLLPFSGHYRLLSSHFWSLWAEGSCKRLQETATGRKLQYIFLGKT